ncbi:LPXTG cell wall anchor domain-containing protein [Microbacterium aquimaris]|uniref:LPXTG cell wall anchor domain-containing protein n=1 Tax=Microbacterium aquimaris TaxID=459816 RepID=A0ABU5N3T2_9MICO|nr:LPXTG cell wall anchor domain-containing protein [Microbacterium aquimaris]MDZ8160729.1 LPXTG cell wall anchor domain-containing protein [Microbacterium aquimaris]
MHTIVKRALWGAVIGGGISLLGAGVAQAADTSGEDGLLSGTQAIVDVDAPITVSGNAISVLGDSHSEGADTQAPAPAPAPEASTSGSDGAASGSQAIITVEVPITMSGNAVSVAGDSHSDGAHTSSGGSSESAPEASTSGDDSVAGGTQGVVSVEAPVTVSGNAISVLGDSESTDASTGTTGNGNGGNDTAANTSGDDSVAGGTQVVAPVEAPVTVGGNAISLIGDSQSTDATTGNGGGHGSETNGTTNGDDSLLGGTQVIASIEAPVTVGGNAISLIGDSESTDATTGNGGGSNGGDSITGGSDSILGGTQVLLPIELPITIGGNAISVIGDSETTSPTTPGTPGDPTDPTDPTDPGTPIDPGTPAGPTTPSTPVTAASSGSPVTAMPAAAGTTAVLAATGGHVAGWAAGLGLLVLLAGLVLARRRASIG